MTLYKPKSDVLPGYRIQAAGTDFSSVYFQTLHKSMPVDRDGMVKDPRYVPKERQAGYLELWRKWASDHPKDEWPSFLSQLALEKKLKQEKAR